MKIGSVLENWRDRLSLQQQVAGITALLCVVLVLSCAAVAAEIARQQAAGRVENSILGTANSMEGRLETYMDERFRDIRDLASLSSLGMTWGGDPSRVRATLDHLQTSVPDFEWVGFVGTTGTVIAASLEMLEGISVADRQWFKVGLTEETVQDADDATLFAELLAPPASSEPHRLIDVAVPVKGPSGATEGVLAGYLNGDWLLRIRDHMVSLSASSRQNEIWILRSDGHMLMGPQIASKPLPDDIISQARSGRQPIFIDHQGEETLTAVVSPNTGVLADLGWIVVVRRPLGIAMAEAHHIALTILGIGLILALLGTAAASLLAARLTRPLAQLTVQVDQLGRDPTATTISRRGGSSDVRHLSSAVRSLLLRAGSAEFAKEEAERISTSMQERFDERTRALGEHISTLQQQADTDSLTHLLNRRAFLVIASDAMNYFRRYGREICILVIDIDFFKRVNDTFGHGAGDDVIQFVGAAIQSAVRTTDKVARFGGEEFVVLLRETDLPNAILLAERIRGQICDGLVEVRNDRTVHVTASVGVALARSEDRDIADVIERADRALYVAKTSGRNRVQAAVEIAMSDAA